MDNSVDPGKFSAVNQIVLPLSALLSDLLDAARQTSDVAKLEQLNAEYAGVQACLFQATQAQTMQDEALFRAATSVLNGQAKTLQQRATHIDALVADAALAGRITSYINEVAALATTL